MPLFSQPSAQRPMPASLLGTLMTIGLILVASPAWAVQNHGGAEGLVAHQLGHLAFVGGIMVLLYYIRHNRLNDAGWRFFSLFFWLLLAWNSMAFTNHWLHNHIPPDHFIVNNGHCSAMTITNLTDLIFYLSAFDHLLLVPALLLLLLALRFWEKSP